jgi:hypothetical protein
MGKFQDYNENKDALLWVIENSESGGRLLQCHNLAIRE